MKNLTIQNLKERKSYIIAKIKYLGMEDRTKAFMGVMLFEVNEGFAGTIFDLAMQVYHSMRTTKIKKMAEICGNGFKKDGREVNYSITKYL